MNEDKVADVRLSHLEDSQKEFKGRVSIIENDLTSIKVKQAENSVTLKRIEGLLKWATGGIVVSILGAIGKFIVSGKLSQ